MQILGIVYVLGNKAESEFPYLVYWIKGIVFK